MANSQRLKAFDMKNLIRLEEAAMKNAISWQLAFSYWRIQNNKLHHTNG
jgi:hypothetical protein